MNYVERNCDLFLVGEEYALAHCISADVAMGAGIAKQFDKKFPMMKGVVKTRHSGIGTACMYAYWDKEFTYIFNLITKNLYWHKPTLRALRDSLIDLRNQCLKFTIKYLAMPRIGCGLDKLNWDEVKPMIEEIFTDVDIEILICYKENNKGC
jgi:O-acetyl-ADP-ribose deacetylase (regulator of RNase III)